MKGATTYLQDPENPKEEPRSFSFDHSYWSHDGCKEEASGYFGPDSSHKNGKKFCDQKMVFKDLGQGVLTNAWDGYNSTLFAYGQTGSGKSWSVVGYGPNKGIVPQFCDTLFQGIEQKKSAGEKIEFEVTFSMLEIYNEVVRDLLNPSKDKGGLKVRQHPKKGFYPEGLKMSAVDSYKAIEAKMEEGTTNRTVAATNMNATSSRAHTIVGITFVQKFKNAAGEETAKTAIVNLVDLAGSERADSTGATGDRLKEGAAINQSLSSLGNCIAALADRSSGKNVKVPFRDSVLTKLLKNALGGNSKTIMIAAISPADINYDETLSTLRYADRAKQIKTKATVNEDPTEKLIRELQEENDRLKKMLESGGVVLPSGDGEGGIEDDGEMTEEEKAAMKKELEEEYQAALEENKREMEEMRKAFEQKLEEERQAGGNSEAIGASIEKRKTIPHISNLNFDPQLSGHIVHFLDEPVETVGNGKKDVTIKLVGPSIQEDHGSLTIEKGKYYVEKGSEAARILVNGKLCNGKVELHHNDRLMFGTTQLFVYIHPEEREKSGKAYETVTYEMAQEEIASNSGFDMNTQNKSKDDMLLQEDLVDMLPVIEEINGISTELDKKKKFEACLVSPEARGELSGRTQIFVKVVDLETDLEWMWPKEKFMNRKFVMQEMYENYKDGDKWELPSDRDPFEEDYNSDVHVGSVKVWLGSLAYNIDSREQLEICDYKGDEVGLLNIELVPCNQKGVDYSEADDVWVNDQDELIGKNVYFNVKITSARGLPNRYNELYAKFSMYLDKDQIETTRVKGTSNPDWKFCKQFSFEPATEQFVRYLAEKAIMVQIWGKYKPPKDKKKVNTKDALGALMKGGSVAASGGTQVKTVDTQKVRYAMELAMLKKRKEKLEHKVNQFKQLVEAAEKHDKPRLSVSIIRDLLHAPSQDVADKCLKMVPQEKVLEGEREIALEGTVPAGSTKSDPPKKPDGKASGQKKAPPKKEKQQKRPNSADSKKSSSTCVLL